jgi:hypothetical protein
MRIELRIDRLVTDDLSGWSADELAPTITRELRRVLAHELGRAQGPAARRAAGRAIGDAVARAVTGDKTAPGARGPR